MKTLKFVAVLAGFSLCLNACHKDEIEDKELVLSDEYLPLQVGNYWQMENQGKQEITGTKEINNKMYYQLEGSSDTLYYRIDNDKVYVLNHEGQEGVKFDLSAELNETWTYNLYTVQLISKTDTVSINNKQIKNCYQFYFDIPIMADDEHAIWLAPGIGFIQTQCGECLNPILKLEMASIDGQDIDF